MPSLPQAEQRVLETPFGPVVGASYRWDGGQYCAIHTSRGVVGCGIFDLACADRFDILWAARGGYGASRLLPLLDKLMRERGVPKQKKLLVVEGLTVRRGGIHVQIH